MSFASDVKTELCRAPLSRKCCVRAEAYGVLLYCNTFHGGEARVVTENEAFAQRLPALFKKAFHLTFDRLPEGSGKQVFAVTDPDKLAILHHTFGSDSRTLALHVNFAMLEENCCRAAFLRGAFLAGGSVTEPPARNAPRRKAARQQSSSSMAKLTWRASDRGSDPNV